jgi:hypothetical protein
MTIVMVSLFVDVHPSKDKLTLFLDGIRILTASTLGVYSLQQMLLSMLADGRSSSLRNVLYDCHSCRFQIALNGI